MARPTVEDDDELDRMLAAYGLERGLTGSPAEVAQAALRALLAADSDRLPFRPFKMTPIAHDDEDGPTDISINHDAYFADWTWETQHGPTHPPDRGQRRPDE